MNTEFFKDGGWIQGGGIGQSAVTLWNYCRATKGAKTPLSAAIDGNALPIYLKEPQWAM